jgi:hypothetical protein
MRIATLLLLSIVVGAGAMAGEPDKTVALILGEALKDDRAHRRLAWLTDHIGPRLSGSANLERAVEWSVAELRTDGLDRVWTEPVMVPHWVRGEETARLVGPREQPMRISTFGGSVATPPEGITAEVVEAGDFEELEALGDGVRHKIVLYNKEIFRNGGPNRDRGYGSAVGLRRFGAIRAAKQGAVATLMRSLGTADFDLPHTGMMGYEDGVQKIPSAAVTAEDAELMSRLLAAGETVRVHLTIGARTLPDAESHNVVADLRGREKPDEIVLIACHLDSWDVGTGAIDDGAGCVVVMEALRILKGLDAPPRRTVRGVLYTNEENGLRGGRNYAEVHADELDLHVAAIESDSGAGSPRGFGVSAGPGGVERMEELVSALAHIGADGVRSGGGGADISPLGKAQVPLMNLWQDTTHYFDYHHSAADTLDKVDPGDLARNVAAMAVMAYLLAESETPLPRQEPPALPEHRMHPDSK